MQTDIEATGAAREHPPAEGGRDEMPPRRTGRITVGAILALLMAAIIVPSLVFAVLLLQRNDRAQQEMVAMLAEATAGSITEAVDRHLTGMLNTLRVLSISRAARQDDLDDFYVRAGRALDSAGAHLIVADEDLNQLIATHVPLDTPLGKLDDAETARRALETGQPQVSDAYLSTVAQKWVFSLMLPLTLEAGGRRLLILNQDVERLADALTGKNLRGGWNAVIVDRRRTVLASSFMSADIGKPFFLDGDPRPASATVRTPVVRDGQSYDTIRAASSLTGWETIVWAPMAVVRAPMTRSLRVLALGGLGLIALGAALALLLGWQVAKPVRRLARDARRLGAGEDVEAVDYPVAEIATVSQALAQASRDRQAAENEIRFLMREVAHRSKNQLTVVSAIAKQSARHARTFAGFQDAFQKRVQGLARSTDLLLAGGVAGVEMKMLLEAQIEPFRPSDASRMSIEGPLFRLSNPAAQTIGLAVHELATNAAKYGAFATPEGRLVVTWKRRAGNLDLVWREHVPRLRRRAATRGFGTEVIERMLGGSLGAQIHRVLHRDGLECRFVIPVERLEPETAEQDQAGRA